MTEPTPIQEELRRIARAPKHHMVYELGVALHDTLDRLEVVKHERDEMQEKLDIVREQRAEYAAWLTEAAGERVTREALVEFGEHAISCPVAYPEQAVKPRPCICGLDAALSAAQETSHET